MNPMATVAAARNAPTTCAIQQGIRSFPSRPPRRNTARTTAGSSCAPDTCRPKQIITVRADRSVAHDWTIPREGRRGRFRNGRASEPGRGVGRRGRRSTHGSWHRYEQRRLPAGHGLEEDERVAVAERRGEAVGPPGVDAVVEAEHMLAQASGFVEELGSEHGMHTTQLDERARDGGCIQGEIAASLDERTQEAGKRDRDPCHARQRSTGALRRSARRDTLIASSRRTRA